MVAVGILSQSINFTPPAVNAGVKLMEQGRLEDAIAKFDAAIRAEPICAPAYANRAKAYVLLGRDTDAQRDIETAVAQGFDLNTLEEEIAVLKQQFSVRR